MGIDIDTDDRDSILRDTLAEIIRLCEKAQDTEDVDEVHGIVSEIITVAEEHIA